MLLYRRKCFASFAAQAAVLCTLAVLFAFAPLHSQTKKSVQNPKLKDGESVGDALFKEDKGEQAIAPLEREIAAGEDSADKYNFLGLAYYQAGDYKRSIAAFERGMKASGSDGAARWALSYNAGNSAFADGNFAGAEGYYSDAYRMNGEFHAALLNRANARLNQDKLVEARDDYALYLERAPDSPQYERISALIGLLDEDIKAHAILPEKLEASVAVLSASSILSADEEAVDDIYTEVPSPPPAAAEAMEKEAAFLHSTAPAAVTAEQMEKSVIPPLPPLAPKDESEAIEDTGEAQSLIRAQKARMEKADSEAMEKSESTPPPVQKKRSNDSEETLENSDIAAPPPVKKARKKAAEEAQDEAAEKIVP